MKTKKITLYRFDELDDEAREKVEEWVMNNLYEDWDLWQDIISTWLEDRLEPLGYPTDRLCYAYTHCQGDGVAFYGKIKKMKKQIDRLFDEEEVEGIKKMFAEIEERLGYKIDLFGEIEKSKSFHLYDHQNTMVVSVDADISWIDMDGMYLDDVDLEEEFRDFLEDLETRLQDDVREVSKKLHSEGYDMIDDVMKEEFEYRMESLKEDGEIFLKNGKRGDYLE